MWYSSVSYLKRVRGALMFMSVRGIVAGVLPILYLLLGACQAGADTQSAARQPWQLGLEISGGIAGLHRYATLAHDGSLYVIDRKQKREHQVQIPVENLEAISRQLAKLDVVKIESAVAERCADCIHFELEISLNSAHRRVRTDSVSFASTEYGTLLEEFVRLVDSTFIK